MPTYYFLLFSLVGALWCLQYTCTKFPLYPTPTLGFLKLGVLEFVLFIHCVYTYIFFGSFLFPESS